MSLSRFPSGGGSTSTQGPSSPSSFAARGACSCSPVPAEACRSTLLRKRRSGLSIRRDFRFSSWLPLSPIWTKRRSTGWCRRWKAWKSSSRTSPRFRGVARGRASFFRRRGLGKCMGPSGTIGQVQALLGERRFAEAAPLLIRAAEAGDAAAQAALAHWRIAGGIIRRDLSEARRLLGLAGAQGDADTALLHAYFLASGTGGPDSWREAVAALGRLAKRRPQAAAQLRLIGAMELDDHGFPLRPIGF